MNEIIPGILEKDWKQIEEKIELVLPFAKTIQIDILDGKFAPNVTFLDPEPFRKYADKVILEAHLMVNEPIDYVESFAKAGFKRFNGHIEKMSSQKEYIDLAKKFGEAGLAIDEPTSLDSINIDFNDPDCFLLMSVKTGFSGQSLLPEVFEKIRELRQKTKKPIEVDGGANKETIEKLKDVGVQKVAVTSSLFSASDIAKEYQELQAMFSNLSQ